jgi:hypothetical protein
MQDSIVIGNSVQTERNQKENRYTKMLLMFRRREYPAHIAELSIS